MEITKVLKHFIRRGANTFDVIVYAWRIMHSGVYVFLHMIPSQV